MDNGITVTGTGEASQAPDTFRAQLTVACERADVSSALGAMAEGMNRVSGSLRELGLQDKHLQTTGARVYSRYGKDEVTVVGYRASQALAVICPDVSLAGRCLTAAAEAGGNDLGIDGIRLEISDPAPLRVLARERAFADAHTIGGPVRLVGWSESGASRVATGSRRCRGTFMGGCRLVVRASCGAYRRRTDRGVCHRDRAVVLRRPQFAETPTFRRFCRRVAEQLASRREGAAGTLISSGRLGQSLRVRNPSPSVDPRTS